MDSSAWRMLSRRMFPLLFSEGRTIFPKGKSRTLTWKPFATKLKDKVKNDFQDSIFCIK